MLLSEILDMRWNPRNIDWYVSRGYTYTNKGDVFQIKVKDLPPYSQYKVTVKCDYCGKVVSVDYAIYLRKKDIVDKDACSNCRFKKQEEISFIKYGTKHPMFDPKVKAKQQKAVIDSGMWYSPTVKEKRKQTCLKKFGAENPLQNEEIKKKMKIKQAETFYKYGTQKCSTQQKYLHNVIGGELNYPVGKYNLDIAFPDEKIYIEGDFSGHNLDVKMGQITEKEFEAKERKRSYFLANRGWKQIRIISLKDKLPTETTIINMIEFAKEYLKQGHSWIKFDIDNQKVLSSQFKNDYNFGKVRRIYKIPDKD